MNASLPSTDNYELQKVSPCIFCTNRSNEKNPYNLLYSRNVVLHKLLTRGIQRRVCLVAVQNSSINFSFWIPMATVADNTRVSSTHVHNIGFQRQFRVCHSFRPRFDNSNTQEPLRVVRFATLSID